MLPHKTFTELTFLWFSEIIYLFWLHKDIISDLLYPLFLYIGWKLCNRFFFILSSVFPSNIEELKVILDFSASSCCHHLLQMLLDFISFPWFISLKINVQTCSISPWLMISRERTWFSPQNQIVSFPDQSLRLYLKVK